MNENKWVEIFWFWNIMYIYIVIIFGELNMLEVYNFMLMEM